MKDPQSIFIAYLNGDATDDESRELNDWIRESDENAKQFAEFSLLHGQLRNILVGEFQARESGVFSSSDNKTKSLHSQLPTVQKSSRNRVVAVVSSLAATILIVLVAYFGTGENDDPQSPDTNWFATIRQVSNVKWSTSPLSAQDRIGGQTIGIESGILSLQFDNGVDVTLEGPAIYKLVSAVETELQSGILVADVPPDAIGFRIDTPSANVIDLGTSFGVDVDDAGTADVVVFDGEVEVVSVDKAVTKRISEGQSVRLGVDGNVKTTEFRTNRFENIWPIASRIVESTDSVKFIPPWPRRIRRISSDNEIFLAPEGRSIRLRNPLKVNISEPGLYSTADDLVSIELPEGKFIRSYLLHYSPNQELGPRRAKQITGWITFEKPVIGLIVLQDELVASSHLSRRPANEGQPRRQLELDGTGGDTVRLSEDRHTVFVELTAPGRSSDMIRVIVESDQTWRGVGPRGKHNPGPRGKKRNVRRQERMNK